MTLFIKREQEDCNTDSALSPSSPSGRSQQASSWRSWLRVHPAADLFPTPSDDDIRGLADDIKRHRQREPVSFIRDDKGPVLLDGRSRLDARELAGLKIDLTDRAVFEQLSSSIDATAFVISKNIHRRHLTTEQKRDLIAALLQADPSKSDRAIAKQTMTHHHAVAKVRQEEEGRGNISHVETRTDSKGRQQPASKPKPASAFARYMKEQKEKRRQALALEIERLASKLIENDIESARTLYDILWRDERGSVERLTSALGRGLGIDQGDGGGEATDEEPTADGPTVEGARDAEAI
jgi:hypothetical protein